MEKKGTIYVLSNPAMPGMVKIGKTNDLQRRIKELSSPSGIPVAFECIVAKEVPNADFVENKIHEMFKSQRINSQREFFKIAEETVRALFELLSGEYVSINSDQVFETKEEKIAFEKQSRRRERFKFGLVGIPIGSTLTFLKNESITCEVVSNTQVKFRNEMHSLTSAGLIAVQECGHEWRSIQGPSHWLYEGETCSSLREKLEED